MPFGPPTFNLPVSLWRKPTSVLAAPTRSFMANLALGRRNALISQGGTSVLYPIMEMQLLCPAGTDIAGRIDGVYWDVVEVPAGTSRYYVVFWVDDVGRGFPNQYRFAALAQAHSEILALTGNPWMCPGWFGPPIP